VSGLLQIKEAPMVKNNMSDAVMKEMKKAFLAAIPNFDGSETTNKTYPFLDYCQDYLQIVNFNDFGKISFISTKLKDDARLW
jgi:hypothetical protein